MYNSTYALQCRHSNHECFNICTFFPQVYFFTTFFRTSQSQPRVDATAETYFLPFFHIIFKKVPRFHTIVPGCEWLALEKCKE